jgi:hypothetical protein
MKKQAREIATFSAMPNPTIHSRMTSSDSIRVKRLSYAASASAALRAFSSGVPAAMKASYTSEIIVATGELHPAVSIAGRPGATKQATSGFRWRPIRATRLA